MKSDVWTMPLALVAENARTLSRMSDATKTMGGGEASVLLEILQARATLQAAEIQRKSTRSLVLGTWALVLMTLALVAVTA